MTVRAGREFLAIPGPTTMPDEVLQAMHRPALDIYSAEMIGTDRQPARAICRNCSPPRAAPTSTSPTAMARGKPRSPTCCRAATRCWCWRAAASRSAGARPPPRMGVEVEVLKGDWRRAIRPAEVEARLRQDKDHEIKAIVAVQVDTASGAYNDIEAIGKAIKAAGHPALFMVDTVASLGCMPFEMDAWGIDVAMSGSQKGLMTPPGLGFVAANDRAREVHKKANLRTPYWDWTEREGSRALPEICRHRAGASAVRAAQGDRHAVRGRARERLPAPSPARRSGAPRGRGVVRGPGARLQHRGAE